MLQKITSSILQKLKGKNERKKKKKKTIISETSQSNEGLSE